MECLPPDRLRQGDTVFFRGDTDSAALPRPLGEQLVEGFTRILGTPREPEDQARQLAQFILLEFDIMRRVIT
jgi:hypothetical protein